MMPATIESPAFNHSEFVARHKRIAPAKTNRSRKKMPVPLKMDRECKVRSIGLSKSMVRRLLFSS